MHRVSLINSLLAGVALVMHILIWFVNSNVENAFSTGIVGLMYGPIFPGTLFLATEVLPKEVHLFTMAIMCAIYVSSECLVERAHSATALPSPV